MKLSSFVRLGRTRIADLLAFRDKSIYSLHRLGVYLITGFALIFFGFPIYWMFLSSVKPMQDLTSYPPDFVPRDFTFANYQHLFFETDYLLWLTNSLIVVTGIVVLTVVLSSLAGYALTRYRIPRKKTIAAALIIAYLFPPITLGVPFFVLFLEMGLINNLLSVILATTAAALPFSTWLLWQFFQTVPISLEEAAWVNGASRIRGIFEVVLPSAMPGIIAVVIFSFAIGWNVFLYPFLFLQTPDQQVLTTGIYLFSQGARIHWGSLMGGAAVICLPPLLLVLFLNRYILQGFTVQAQ